MFLAFILRLLAVLILSSYSDGEIYFDTIFPECPSINKKSLVLCSNGTVGMFEWAELHLDEMGTSLTNGRRGLTTGVGQVKMSSHHRGTQHNNE